MAKFDDLTSSQKVNSLRRSLAHQQVHGTIDQVTDTLHKLDKAVSTVAKERLIGIFVPCDTRCMQASAADCDCSCGGVNHKVLVNAAAK